MAPPRNYSPDLVTGLTTPAVTDVETGPRPGLVLLVECDRLVCRTVAFDGTSGATSRERGRSGRVLPRGRWVG